MSRSLGWYARRLRRMSPAEIASRTGDETRRRTWARLQVRPGVTPGPVSGLREDRRFPTPLPPGTQEMVPPASRAAAVHAADRILAGDWELLGTPRTDIADPDWFLDPVTGRRAPQDRLAFKVDHRDETETGNVKAVWELSRHHHLTVLAAAWWLTGESRYAEAVDRQLRSWWTANPFLSGVHWTSGIELGVRLSAWAWVRRLLDGWDGAAALFEDNPDALRQIRWHQQYLDAFRSRGSSANNHVVAEACGRVAAACAFPWYAESQAWRADAIRQLQRELAANTFPSGINRELATDYHRFVAELGVVAGAEADASGHPLDDATWALLTASLDAAAALTDASGRPPRQGDGDEGRALVLDDPEADPWAQLLDLGAGVVGALPWWPQPAGAGSLAGTLVPALLRGRVEVADRPAVAPRSFADAGIAVLRTPVAHGPEIWCRCDGGPHGFLSIAAHAHADALSVEVRHDGVEVLVDPGTYCYHGEPAWRSYFRSTLAHNTLEVAGTSQAVEAGPFLWATQPHSEVVAVDVGPGRRQSWMGRQDGYARLHVTHTRTVYLDASTRTLAMTDRVSARDPRDVRLALHLGPRVGVRLDGTRAELSWDGPAGPVTALLDLPDVLTWRAHRGETDPVLGWYFPRFGQRVPITTLVGSGVVAGRLELRTSLAFAPSADASAAESALGSTHPVSVSGGGPRG
ncbi:MAG: alginate lyase family protein [Nocardioides sp.]